MRSPHLYDTLRRFCLGAFASFHGADLPFAFEEHGNYGRPTLYEYRPLVRGFIEAHADRLYARDDVREAVADLQREHAARIFARAHEGNTPDEGRALYRSVLVPLLVRTAEGCGGFDWDDAAYDRAYEELENVLYRDGHAYGAVAPLIGISVGTEIELGDGIRVRVAATGELSAMWPEAAGLLPRSFGREPDRLSVLELERSVAEEAPDSPGELADAVTALRLATSAPVAAGPVLFERLDWRPYGVRPVLPIAATAPAGEPTRLDPFRASVAQKLRPQLALADDDAKLGDALDRWELALFQDDPFRREQLRHALDSALGNGEGAWAAGMRAAALLGETAHERASIMDAAREPSPDLVRRLLVAVLLHGDRRALLRELDATLLGNERVAQLRAS
ncbi:MAG TPA: hypothetical protein VHQ89_05070 [Gaiellaceae bacterium]|jgi:hypothetical protein|nr:hypothetical protein [Gaiellaceae bacterium]